MAAGRILIVNADDLGQSPGINAGVARAHEAGIVTSASLMVRWPAADDAARYARTQPGLSLGLHVDLGEWSFEEGHWTTVYEVVAHENAVAVTAEVERQLQEFRRLAGVDPTHIDSHQHAHRREPVRSILKSLAHRLGVPLRDECGCVTYSGEFYGQTTKGQPYHQAVTVDALLALLARLPAGVTELGCHPALATDMGGMYRSERLMEVQTLCDARVRMALASHNIHLRSFGPDLAIS